VSAITVSLGTGLLGSQEPYPPRGARGSGPWGQKEAQKKPPKKEHRLAKRRWKIVWRIVRRAVKKLPAKSGGSAAAA
jgi:hypothetical protein